MRKHKRASRMLSLFLAASMTMQSVLPSAVLASEVDTGEAVIIDDNSDETAENVALPEEINADAIRIDDSEEGDAVSGTIIGSSDEAPAPVIDEGNAALPGVDQSEENTVVDVTENTEEVADDESAIEVMNETEASWQQIMTTSGISKSNVGGVDLSSKRLIIAGSEEGILDRENVLSEYEGLYLLQYENAADVATAYAYYLGAAEMGLIEFVDADAVVQAADITGGNTDPIDEAPTGNAEMDEGTNPVAQLADAMEGSTPVRASNVVALIDTGAPATSNVVERVSMIGDDVEDNNGHGSEMLGEMTSVDPNVQVISVKALDENGQGNISSVYTAMMYAIDKGAKVIDLSLSAKSTAENAALKEAVNQATANGIIVVGAAGNQGRNVKYYTPGNIDEAMIVGAATSEGLRQSFSNYGDTVDYNVVASSTSSAAAKMAAYIAKSLDESGYVDYQANVNDLIYTTDYVPSSETEETIVVETDAAETGDEEDINISDDEEDINISDEDADQVLTPDSEVVDDEDQTTETEEVRDEATPIHAVYYFVPDDSNGSEISRIWMGNFDAEIVNGERIESKINTDPMQFSLTQYGEPKVYVSFNAITSEGIDVSEDAVYDSNSGVLTLPALYNGQDLTVVAYLRDSESARAYYQSVAVEEAEETNGEFVEDTDVTGDEDGLFHAQAYSGYDDASSDTVSRFDMSQVGFVYAEAYGSGNDTAYDRYFMDFIPYQCWVYAADGTRKAVNFCNGVHETNTKSDDYKKNGAWTRHKGTIKNGPNAGKEVDIERQTGWYHKWAFTREAGTTFYDKNKTKISGTYRTYCMNPAYQGVVASYYPYNGRTLGDDLTYSASSLAGEYGEVFTVPVSASKPNTKAANIYKALYYLYGGPGWNTTVSGTNLKTEIDKYLVLPDTKSTKNFLNFNQNETAQVEDKVYWAMSHYIMSYIYDNSNDAYRKWAAQDSIVEARQGEAYVGAQSQNNQNWRWIRNEYLLTDEGLNVMKTLAEKVKSMPLPATTMNSTSSTDKYSYGGTYNAAETKMVSEEIKYTAIPENTATITLPAGETLVTASGARYTGTATIPGNTTFRIESSGAGKSGQTETYNVKCKYDTDSYLVILATKDTKDGSKNVKHQDMATMYHKSKRLDFAITWPKTAYLKVVKKSAQPDCTAGNASYSLQGAVFGVYADAACKTQVATLTTTAEYASGNKTAAGKNINYAATGTSPAFSAGTTYYIKEITPSKGYRVNNQVFTAVAQESNTAANPATVEIAEPPLMDPLGITIEKLGDVKSGVNVPDEPIGAEFTIKYYDSLFDNVSAAPAQATRTWVIKTVEQDRKYIAELNANATGDPLYYNDANEVSIPYGTIIITETKAPVGYTVDGAEVTDGNGNKSAFPYLAQIAPTQIGGITLNGRNEATGVAMTDKNARIEIKTIAVDKELGGHFTSSSSARTIVDTVEMKNLSNGQNYILVGELVDESDNNKVLKVVKGESFSGPAAFGETVTDTIEFALSKDEMKNLDGHKLIVNEYLYLASDSDKAVDGDKAAKDKAIASHTIDNMTAEEKEAQRVSVPKVGTTAKASDADNKVIPVSTDASITDTIIYENLEIGKSYKAHAVVKEVVNGEAKDVVDGDGKAIEADGTFTAEKSDGTFDVTIKFNATGMERKTLVVYEYVYIVEDGKETAMGQHEDPNDKNQYVYLPGTITEAYDILDENLKNTHHALPEEKTTIVDKVTFENVQAGLTYEVSGSVKLTDGTDVDAKITNFRAGEGAADAVSKDGKYTFTATASTGYVLVTFEFDAIVLKGVPAVAFEELLQDGREVAVHHDLKSKPQTTLLPMIGTVAISEDTGDHTGGSLTESFITDTIHYEGLESGTTYHFVGQLMDKKTGEKIDAVMVDEAGKELEYVEYTVPASDNLVSSGDVKVRFKVDTSVLEDHTLVAFEQAYLASENKLVAQHTDINDADQSIFIPQIGTSLKSEANNDDHVDPVEKVVVVDTVSYKNLLPGYTYKLYATLHDKADETRVIESVMIDDEDKEIDGYEFTVPADAKTNELGGVDGSVQVRIQFNGKANEGTTIVAFERMTHNDADVAVHADINDQEQTIYIPKVITEAQDTKDEGSENNHHAFAEEKTSITDKVTFTSVREGLVYEVTGSMKMLDGTDVDATVVDFRAGDGAELVESEDGKYSFKATQSEGYVLMTFEFDASVLKGSSVVAFEELHQYDREVAVHHDLQAKAQNTYIPEIGTVAISEDTRDHVGVSLTEAYIEDTVHYVGLEAGQTYHVVGQLMDKKTGEKIDAVIVDAEGNEIEYVEFTVPGASKKDSKEEEPQKEDENTDAEKAEDGEKSEDAAADDSKEEADDAIIMTEGDVIVRFKLDTTVLEDHTLVAFEQVYLPLGSSTSEDGDGSEAAEDKKLVAEHADLEDEEQSVYIPNITTSVKDEKNENDHTMAEEKAVVVDTVFYKNLVPGNTYKVYGTLHDKADETNVIESVMIDEEGNEIDGYEFTVPEDAEKNELGGVDGSVDIRMQFNAKAIEGSTIVAFETLKHNGKDIALHHDINDDKQTEYIPKLRTVATDDKTKSHISNAEKSTLLTDTVTFTGLKAGATYRLRGSIMEKITAEDGSVSGKEVSAYIYGGKLLAAAEEKTEEAKEETPAENEENKQEEKAADEKADEKTEEEKDEKTDDANAEADQKDASFDPAVPVDYFEFTADSADGQVEIYFNVDTTNITSGKMVVFENMALVEVLTDEDGKETEKETPVGKHEDLNDEDQTISVPKISTTALADDTKTHETQAKATTVITDKVDYVGLIPGRNYRMTGTLYSKATGSAFTTSDGKAFSVEKTFTPESADGSVELTFTISTESLAGKSIVVFEKCEIQVEGGDDYTEVAKHEDINDEDQTVSVVDVKTNATSKSTGTHETDAVKDTTVVDVVTYTGLKVGKEYTVKGTLMDKSTGKALEVNGKTVTASATFKPEKADGTVELTFKFDASALAGKSVVAFEDLYRENIKVATHSDLEDADQTVTIVKIVTKLTDKTSGSQNISYGDTVTLTDKVTYTGLTVGKSYTVKGVLMDKSTKKSTGITAEATFKAESANGSVDLDFSVDTTKYAGKSLVAFEKLYDANGKLIASHEDIKDKDQTVKVSKKPTTKKEKTPKESTSNPSGGSSTPSESTPSSDSAASIAKPTTGDMQMTWTWAILTILAAGALCGAVVWRKRRAH